MISTEEMTHELLIPKNDQDSIPSLLNHLFRLYRPHHAVMIGVGQETDPCLGFLRTASFPQVTLVEADDSLFRHLQDVLGDQPNWSLCHQLIAPQRGRTPFYRASVSSENSLVDPDLLKEIWPRIATREVEEMDAISLTDLLGQLSTPADWLFIDCFPSTGLLQSAARNLAGVNLVVARTTTDESLPEHHLDSLVDFMESLGFRHLALEPGRNPGIGQALFAREPVVESEDQVAKLRAPLESEIQSLKSRIDDLEFGRKESDLETLIGSYEATITGLGTMLSDTARQQKATVRQLGEMEAMASLLLSFAAKEKSSQAGDRATEAAVFKESQADSPPLRDAVDLLAKGMRTEALEMLRIARKTGCSRREITEFLLGEIISLAKRQPGLVGPVAARGPRLLQQLAGSAQQALSRSQAIYSELSIDSPWYHEMILLRSEISILCHELGLSLERGQLAKAGEPLLQEPGSLAESNRDWRERLRSLSVSQLGQDLWVLERCSFKREGFFVEFGATNGILLSNSYLLEKEFGWNGICSEPNPEFLEALRENRQCIVTDECIGPVTGEEVEFVFADVFGGMVNDISNDQHRERRQAYLKSGATARLTTISLHDHLLKHKAPRTIDYLSIDTEGSEYAILRAFPFDQWDLRHISVEHNMGPQRIHIRDLLSSFGYECQEAQWDDWYFKP